MKIAIVGTRGQLGTDLAAALGAAGEHELLALSGPEDAKPGDAVCDITDSGSVAETLKPFAPERIFNCAAFNNVDECEEKIETAFLVNVVGVANLADVARGCGATLVHFSTDYVFDGKKDEPYLEDDVPDPQSVYAASKLGGEIILRRTWEKYFLFRVSGLFGEAGASGGSGNFVETMLRLGKEKGAVRVVNDQRLAPTFTADLAEKVIEVVDAGEFGLYHLAASGDCSWFEFAKEIFRLCKIDVDCSPQSTEEAGRKAARPAYSVLSSSKLEKLGITPVRHWREGLAEYLRRRGYRQNP